MGNLEEIEAIRQLKARYFRLMDSKDWEGWRRLFTDDIAVYLRQRTEPTVTGADAFVAYVKGRLKDHVTVHHGHTAEIEITSPTTAQGIWAMADYVEQDSGQIRLGNGHYYENYRKESGVWRIAQLQLVYLSLELREPWPRA